MGGFLENAGRQMIVEGKSINKLDVGRLFRTAGITGLTGMLGSVLGMLPDLLPDYRMETVTKTVTRMKTVNKYKNNRIDCPNHLNYPVVAKILFNERGLEFSKGYIIRLRDNFQNLIQDTKWYLYQCIRITFEDFFRQDLIRCNYDLKRRHNIYANSFNYYKKVQNKFVEDKKYKIEEINFETNLKYDDILRITEKFFREKQGYYKLYSEAFILYEMGTLFTDERIWSVPIVPVDSSIGLEDIFLDLIISDERKKPICLLGNLGMLSEVYEKLSSKKMEVIPKKGRRMTSKDFVIIWHESDGMNGKFPSKEIVREIYSIKEINFDTNLKYNDIMRIAKKFIEERNVPYEFYPADILYEVKPLMTYEPIWSVSVIPSKRRRNPAWKDNYEDLVISDKTGRPICLLDAQEVICEIYEKLSSKKLELIPSIKQIATRKQIIAFRKYGNLLLLI